MKAVFAVALLAMPAVPAAVPTAVPAPVVAYAIDADDLATGVVTDSSGHGLDGRLVNGSTAATVPGADGLALDLPGGAAGSGGAYVELPRGILADRADLTVSVRVRWDGGAAPWQWIYALGKDTGRYLFTTPSNGDGMLRTAITATAAGGEAKVTGYAALPAGAWKTLTVTLDTGADRLTTYLDGAAVASAATAVSAADLIDAATTTSGFLGRSFYPDPLFDGAVDDFRVWGSALSAAAVAEAAGGTTPAPTALSTTAFDVRTTIGVAPALPAATRAAFTDGYDRDVPIAWDPVDPADYAARGTFTVRGTAAGQQVVATVTVIREGEITIDLGDRTGAFHGGAAGTLYGLYGPGIPTGNLIEGMRLRTVSTKAQDGPQHPGADALEVVKPLADSTGGDVYIYMTDIHRGFPYQWPGDTPEEKLGLFEEKIAKQVDQVLALPPQYRDNVVFVPFNEPEGNMFGTGEWSYDGTSWLDDPADYFRAWDEVYALIKGRMPAARIAGPNTSVLFTQVRGFLEHAVAAGTVPDVMTWHELSHPEQVRQSVRRYRAWEAEILGGRRLPININEYAFNYHTSVPGQMIQWVSAIEESKVDGDIAYWNIDGNLSDSAVQANRANGQWWLFNAYGAMTGQTVRVDPPFPGQNYTLKGVATIDEAKKQSRAIIGGAAGAAHVRFTNVPPAILGGAGQGGDVHAVIREIPWSGQIGDSGPPQVVAERNLRVSGNAVEVDLAAMQESSAYEIVLSPGRAPEAGPERWQQSYEAEDAVYTGGGYSRNGPEGSPADVSKFYTSGGFNVGGLRTGSDGVLDFTVDVPTPGRYDLAVFANSLNTFDLVREQGPTNVFLRVDGAAEREMFLPLGYKWVVWDHADTTVVLTAGRHTISLAARSLDGAGVTRGDAIVDRIRLATPGPAAAIYQAELADLHGASLKDGSAALRRGESVTFWVYSAADAEAVIDVGRSGPGRASLTVNGIQVPAPSAAVSLSGGINKVTVTGETRVSLIDRLSVRPHSGALPATSIEAETAQTAGSAAATPLSLASGGSAVTGIGGAPGNGNTLTFSVPAARAGTYAMRVRFSNPEQSPATHYNPDPLARHADLTINGVPKRVFFPHSFHRNTFWELTVPVELRRGANTIRFASEELPNFDGRTYASQTFPGILLRSQEAPIIDRITVLPFSAAPGR